MGSIDFHVDFNIEAPNISDEFNLEVEQALRNLATHHSDLTDASVSLESIVKTESPYLYQVRVVLYKRPEDIAVVEKGIEPMVVLKGALDAIEEKVRSSREKLAQRESRRAGANDAVFQELTAEEVYATYAGDQGPEEFLSKRRTEIASELMVEEGLEQEAAYFAADQILCVAQENANKAKDSAERSMFSMPPKEIKESYQYKTELQLKKIRTRIITLEKKAEEAEADIKVRHRQKLSQIRGQFDQINEHLNELRKSIQGAWLELRTMVEDAINTLEEAINVMSHSTLAQSKD